MWLALKRASCWFWKEPVVAELPLVAMSIVSVSRKFFNSLLTPSFVHLFSGNSSVNLFAMYLFKYKLLSKFCPHRWIPCCNCCLLTNTAMTSAVTNFWCHKLLTIVNKLKKQWHRKFYLKSVWRKTPYFKHRKYPNLYASSISAEYLQKKRLFYFPSNIPKVRWVLSYVLYVCCSKFHTLSSYI